MFATFVNSCQEIFAKSEINFRENAKNKNFRFTHRKIPVHRLRPDRRDQARSDQAWSDRARKKSDGARKVTQDGKEFCEYCLKNFFTFSRIFSLCCARFFIFFTGDRLG
jgi:hypothetical protein